MSKIAHTTEVHFKDPDLETIIEISEIGNDYYGAPAIWVTVTDKRTKTTLAHEKINIRIMFPHLEG